jgi:hypothetical protein
MLITDLSFPVLLENNQFIVGGLALNRQLQTQMDYSFIGLWCTHKSKNMIHVSFNLGWCVSLRHNTPYKTGFEVIKLFVCTLG